jgi:hypothetical protein
MTSTILRAHTEVGLFASGGDIASGQTPGASRSERTKTVRQLGDELHWHDKTGGHNLAHVILGRRAFLS